MTAILVMAFCSAFSQEITNPAITEPLPKPTTAAGLLSLSHNQKTTGFVFLGITGLSIAILAPGKVDWDTGGTIATFGLASALAAIPFFIASGRNKRRATFKLASQKTTYGLPYGEKNINGICLSIPVGK